MLEVVVGPGETMFLPLGWWHQAASLDVSLSSSYSCLTLPNHYEYPDPAAPHGVPTAASATNSADAMKGALLNAVKLAGVAETVEIQFRDGSAMHFRVGDAGTEMRVSRTSPRGSDYAERLDGAAWVGTAPFDAISPTGLRSASCPSAD